MKVLTMQLNSTSVMDIVAYGGAAIGMAVAVSEFLKGNISVSGTLCIVLLASEFFLPLRLLGSFFHIAMNGMAASDKIFKILDLPEPQAGEKCLPDGALDVSLKDVHFSYEADREILKGINLNLPAGSFVSLVGESGCGKSTIAGILAAKNRGYAGEITIGGESLSEINEADLMKHVVLVRHNSYLFKGTVEENLRMAKPDATKEEMEAVLQKVNLLGFLQTQWKYECECGFNVWHTVAKVELSEEILTELFTTGKTKRKVTGFTSKAGNVFDTCLKFENDQISFDFDNPGEAEVQSTAEVQNNVEAQSNANVQNNAEVPSAADDAPDETTLDEMGIPEEFLAGFNMAAESAQTDDVSEAALAAAHELFGE